MAKVRSVMAMVVVTTMLTSISLTNSSAVALARVNEPCAILGATDVDANTKVALICGKTESGSKFWTRDTFSDPAGLQPLGKIAMGRTCKAADKGKTFKVSNYTVTCLLRPENVYFWWSESYSIAKAVERSFETPSGTFKRKSDFEAIRSDINAQTTWLRKAGESNYVLYIGEMVNKSAGESVPDRLFTDLSLKLIYFGSPGNPKLALFYKPTSVFNISSADGTWAFSQKALSIGDKNQMAFLVYDGPGGRFFDFRPIVDRDGSLYGRSLKVACNLSSWGEPIANGVLNISELSLTALSYMPGGQLAGYGSVILSSVSMATKATPPQNVKDVLGETYNQEEYVRGILNLEVPDLKTANYKVGQSMKIALKNGGSTVTYAKVKSVVRTTKGLNIVMDYAASIDTTRSLFETIRTAKSTAAKTSKLCASLN